ncbi:MAG TPA: dihydrofolate reductase family protein [Streptosporangiaceae bacterium]|nr:dihydrofolate reductase family protein [Streptosporangiaceae bacterium]
MGGQRRPVRPAGYRPDDVRLRLPELGREPAVPRACLRCDPSRAGADGKDVLVAGGVSIAQQALAAGLVDEVVLHVVPKLAGRGVRLFGGGEVDLRCVETIEGEGAVHLRYEVR